MEKIYVLLIDSLQGDNMNTHKNNSRLYRYFLLYFIIQIASFMFIYSLLSNTDSVFELGRLLMAPLLVFVFISTNVFILYLLKKLFIVRRKYNKMGMELLKFKYLESDLKLYRQHRHDMKNHLLVIYELVQSKKYDELSDYTKSYLDLTSSKLYNVNTGLDELDVLLYNKFDLAKSNNINIEYHCFTTLSAHYNTMIDLISIISNLLDNSIEANMKIVNSNDRVISVNVDSDQLDYSFVITNAFLLDTNTIDSNFVTDGFTTKLDAVNHGLGLSIVDKLVAKYDGHISFEIFNDMFYQVKIEIPKHML